MTFDNKKINIVPCKKQVGEEGIRGVVHLYDRINVHVVGNVTEEEITRYLTKHQPKTRTPKELKKNDESRIKLIRERENKEQLFKQTRKKQNELIIKNCPNEYRHFLVQYNLGDKYLSLVSFASPKDKEHSIILIKQYIAKEYANNSNSFFSDLAVIILFYMKQGLFATRQSIINELYAYKAIPAKADEQLFMNKVVETIISKNNELHVFDTQHFRLKIPGLVGTDKKKSQKQIQLGIRYTRKERNSTGFTKSELKALRSKKPKLNLCIEKGVLSRIEITDYALKDQD